MPGVSPVGLRALLLALQAAGLCGLRQVRRRADPVELLDHEPPAGRRLQRNLEIRALKLREELRTPARSAGAILARDTSPVTVSIHSAEICARC